MADTTRTSSTYKTVLLVNPDFVSGYRNTVAPRIWPPLELGIIASILENNGLVPKLVDLASDPQSPQAFADAAAQAGLLILSSGQYDRWQCPPLDLEPARRISMFARRSNPELPILGIGPRTLYEPEGFGKLIDYCIKGEPEGPLLNLNPENLSRLGDLPNLAAGKDISEAPRVEYADLGRLPIPKHWIFTGRYLDPVLGSRFTLMETTRGCPHGCHFCFQTMYGRKRRLRPLDAIGEEIERLVSMGYESLIMADQDFAADREHALAVCESFAKAGSRLPWTCATKATEIDEQTAGALSKAGCCFVAVGIETGSDRVHDKINTGIDLRTVRSAIDMIKRHGMFSAGYIRFGHPTETDGERRESIRFATSIPLDFVSFGPVIPLGPTPLGRSVHADLNAARQSQGKYRTFVLRAYLKFYFRPNAERLRLLLKVTGNSLKLKTRIVYRRIAVKMGKLI